MLRPHVFLIMQLIGLFSIRSHAYHRHSLTPMLAPPVTIGALQLRNRIIRAAAFDGQGVGHGVSEQLILYHCAVAAYGISSIVYKPKRNQRESPLLVLRTQGQFEDCHGLLTSL